MVIIIVCLDDELKKGMERLKEANCNQVIRNAIKKRINLGKQTNLAKAVLLNEKIRKTAPEGFNSTTIIRKWRDRNFITRK